MGEHINKGIFLLENVWLFCQAAKKSGHNNEMTPLPRWLQGRVSQYLITDDWHLEEYRLATFAEHTVTFYRYCLLNVTFETGVGGFSTSLSLNVLRFGSFIILAIIQKSESECDI